MIRFKPKRLKLHTFEGRSGPILLRHVAPLALTVEQLCAQFYRQGMKPSFRFERLGVWNGGRVWIRAVPLSKL